MRFGIKLLQGYQRAQKKAIEQQKREQYLRIKAALASTGDEEKDRLTQKNTMQNQSVSKKENGLAEPKNRTPIKIDLHRNVTQNFDRTQSVHELVSEELQIDKGYRKTLPRTHKLRSILKTSSRRGEQEERAAIEAECHSILVALADNIIENAQKSEQQSVVSTADECHPVQPLQLLVPSEEDTSVPVSV